MKGPMIPVNNDVRRNVSRFKKISPEVRKELSKRSDIYEDNEIVIPNPPKDQFIPVLKMQNHLLYQHRLVRYRF